MSAITFYLLKSPRCHDILKKELRARFKSLSEIDITSTSQLPYLQAVIKEGMRIFPANSQGLPRKSPGTVVDGHFVPEGVSISKSVELTRLD
jgi:cytochrome P450